MICTDQNMQMRRQEEAGNVFWTCEVNFEHEIYFFIVLKNRNNFHDHDPSHGFEADMTPEEIFNMFFGGGEINLSTISTLIL